MPGWREKSASCSLTEDEALVPSTHMAGSSHLSVTLVPEPLTASHRCAHRQNTNEHEIKVGLKNNKRTR